jgi:hypothetical protein
MVSAPHRAAESEGEPAMQYLLSMFQPGDTPPPSVDMQRIMRELDDLRERMQEAGQWVFAGGLQPLSTATVLRDVGGEIVMTDGPFAESKEFLGGFTIADCPDLDAALEWAKESTRITGLPTEVRPFRWS